MGRLVFDAQPLIAFALDEPSADLVEARMRECAETGGGIIAAVNWCEVLYVIQRHLGHHSAARSAHLIEAARISIADVDARIAGVAADLKARHGLGLGDAFAAALALDASAPLLTGDADFLPLAAHGLTIEWVGAPPG